VTIGLGGKTGALTYYLTNGKGPIAEIDLALTDSASSTVAVSVRKPKAIVGDDGLVGIGEIDGSGVKGLSLGKTFLDGSAGSGIRLTGFLGSLTIGNIVNGADVVLSGPPPKAGMATRLKAGVIGDGTDISVAGAPMGSLTATAVGVGTISAPSVGTIAVKGKPATKTAPAIPGDFRSSLTVAGTGVAKGPALKSLRVAGAVSGATIIVGSGMGTVGDVGRVTARSFVDSELLAGYAGSVEGSGAFNTGTLGSFAVTGRADAFARSYLIASNMKTVSLASIDPGNGGTKFGVVFHTLLKSLSVRSPAFQFDPAGPTEQDLPSSDFWVRKA